MNVRTRLQALATVVTLGMLIASAPSTAAHAAKKDTSGKTALQCLAQGYEWDELKGCADKACSSPELGTGHHKQVVFGMYDAWYCDGFTGTWVMLRRPPASGQAAPSGGLQGASIP
jgi:hypothetical protein